LLIQIIKNNKKVFGHSLSQLYRSVNKKALFQKFLVDTTQYVRCRSIKVVLSTVFKGVGERNRSREAEEELKGAGK
jgi:hypothetical protein